MLKHDSEKAKEVQAIATQLEINERSKLQREGYQILSKQELLAHVEYVEMQKATAMGHIVMAAQMGQIPKEAVPQAAEVVKLKALDELFKAKNINNDDIVIAFIKHGIQETEEFKGILQKAQQHVQNTVM